MRTPRIQAVEALPGFKARIAFDGCAVAVIDVNDIVDSCDIFAPIRETPTRFDAVSINEYGYGLHWSDLMEIPCTLLWQRARAVAAA